MSVLIPRDVLVRELEGPNSAAAAILLASGRQDGDNIVLDASQIISIARNSGVATHSFATASPTAGPAAVSAPAPAATAPSGPGTELKALLKDWLGIQASPNCSCNARARQMDEWGPDLCEQNLSTIVDWLGEQAAARKLPFVRFAAEQAVKLAIRRARKKAAK